MFRHIAATTAIKTLSLIPEIPENRIMPTASTSDQRIARETETSDVQSKQGSGVRRFLAPGAFGDRHIFGAHHQESKRFLTIASRAPHLLIIGFNGARRRNVNHRADIERSSPFQTHRSPQRYRLRLLEKHARPIHVLQPACQRGRPLFSIQSYEVCRPRPQRSFELACR